MDLSIDITQFEKLKKSGTGWGRLHLKIDSSATSWPMAANILGMAASEIYVNGKLVKQNGFIAKNSNETSATNTTEIIALNLKPGVDNVIAVKLGYVGGIPYLSPNFTPLPTFTFTLNSYQNAIISQRSENSSAKNSLITIAIIIGVFLILATEHMINASLAQYKLVYFYYALFCVLFAISLLIWAFSPTMDNIRIFMWGVFSVSILFIIIYLFLILTVYALFDFQNRMIFYSLCIVGLGGIISEYYSEIAAYIFCSNIFPILCLIESARIAIWAVKHKKKDATLILTGISLCMVFNTWSVFLDQGTTLAVVVFNLSFLSFPIGMSFYLAFQMAQNNRTLKSTLIEVESLSAQTIAQEQEKQHILTNQKAMLEAEVMERTRELNQSLERSDSLLKNILPADIAEELKTSGGSEARLFDEVTVLFTDFVNFTTISEWLSPKELVNELHYCFKAFDEIMSRYGIEKIKTIGDAYLAVAGLPNPDSKHASNAINAAIEVAAFISKRKQQLGDKTFDVRIGVHSGSVVAGIVGVKKFAYDIWGDTVNTAARMEQNSEPGKINVSEKTYALVKDTFSFTYRGEIAAKNKGNLKMYFANGI
ncbi:adenylate/guanylate cyclase domain-containing protein [Mucilaginibacter ginkgonis]|uniref:Uncharacterized protein n=1 Tax=Mucilaginibacter ginkgonis TaxID=2682091 RepID=A0A6I4HWU1_9SPHI|nr:adenylate/guanylate cyclase domain-containing protein [Mucilaginibacter ginkgonis]QQL49925.1 hypothetical protein GO620_000290 [Mucilaginibacter ginkgonis]